MAFKTRRQGRYNVLRKSGFQPFEARPLSRVPFNVPYMTGMLRERLRDYEAAIKKGWTQTRYEEAIKRLCKDRHWITKTRTGKRRYDPWAMLRGYENRYKEKHPEYVSPWVKRRKDFRKYVRELEESIAKYPRGYGKKPLKIRYLDKGGAEIEEE